MDACKVSNASFQDMETFCPGVETLLDRVFPYFVGLHE